jgi:predicted HTH domain antitoxin
MITIDDKNLQLSEEQEKDIRLEIAIMLYEKADYSFYVAAKFAGLHWMDFVKELGKREISIFDEETVLRDIEMAKKHAKNNS